MDQELKRNVSSGAFLVRAYGYFFSAINFTRVRNLPKIADTMPPDV